MTLQLYTYVYIRKYSCRMGSLPIAATEETEMIQFRNIKKSSWNVNLG